MRDQREIKAMITRLEADPRCGYPPANSFTNAPLALVQVELKAQIAALRWAAGLDAQMDTSAATMSRKKKKVVS